MRISEITFLWATWGDWGTYHYYTTPQSHTIVTRNP